MYISIQSKIGGHQMS